MFKLSGRTRRVLCGVLLLAALTFVAVAWLHLVGGAETDPRDTLLSRAAGVGFTDTAAVTLFNPVTIAGPWLAVCLWTSSASRRAACLVYIAVIGVGVWITVAAAMYGFNAAGQLADNGQIWITEKAATLSLVSSSVWVILALVGLLCLPKRSLSTPSVLVSE